VFRALSTNLIKKEGFTLNTVRTGAVTRVLRWGGTMGFCIMQAAAGDLTGSEQSPARQNLYIVSGHPGPGYRDAFEYVTRCVMPDKAKNLRMNGKH